MKSEFVSIVSHQLRTPLSALKWSLDLLRGKRLGDLNEKQREYLDIINDSGIKMIDLVNDLLNVSRIEQRRLEVQVKSFSIEELIDAVVKELEALAMAHNVRVSFKNRKNLPKVHADPDKITMVIQNLIDNAIKFTDQKGKILIAATAEDKKAIIEISDTGVGILEEDLSKIFNRFFHIDRTGKNNEPSTGLGLSIVKSIIDIHNGNIDVKSKPGEGTTFIISLPAL